ncbi:MAG: transglutaminase domain-containing protein [Nanoarchaeota archaeon]|nr:transglutaminase domain-containing protein [Nanoarchaeota archaeon]
MRPDLVEALRRQAREFRDLNQAAPPYSPPFHSSPSLVQTLRLQRPETPSLPDDYAIFVNDDTVVNPFAISNGLLRIIARETRGCATRESKARRIFDWMQQNIDYDEAFQQDKSFREYATSLETLRRGKGVCGEQAFLYIAMARSVGLESGYVRVTRDYEDEKVHHGCASVNIERGSILVDPAYHQFDINHYEYTFLNDSQTIKRFQKWRR